MEKELKIEEWWNKTYHQNLHNKKKIILGYKLVGITAFVTGLLTICIVKLLD